MVLPLVAGLAVETGLRKTNQILSEMNERLSKMQRDLEEASPALKGTKELLDRQFRLVLKPIGDMMTLLMRPFIIEMRNRLRTGLKKIADVRVAMKEGLPEEIGLQYIAAITKEMAGDFFEISERMNEVIGPVTANLDGFIAGTKLITSRFGRDFKAAADGIVEAFVTHGQSYTDDLETAYDTNVTAVETEGKEAAKDFVNDVFTTLGNVIKNAFSNTGNMGAGFGSTTAFDQFGQGYSIAPGSPLPFGWTRANPFENPFQNPNPFKREQVSQGELS